MRNKKLDCQISKKIHNFFSYVWILFEIITVWAGNITTISVWLSQNCGILTKWQFLGLSDFSLLSIYLEKKISCELVPIMRREHSLPSWQMAAEKKSWKVTSVHMGSWNRLANFFLTSKYHSCGVLSSYFWN